MKNLLRQFGKQQSTSLKQTSRKSLTQSSALNTTIDVKKHSLKDKSSWVGVTESLIPETLEKLEKDELNIQTMKQLKQFGQEKLTLEEKKKLRRSLENMNVPHFHEYLKQNQLSIDRKPIEIFQMNIGLYCNQACNHCHVESSPKRTEEQMSREIVDKCVELISQSPKIHTLDITGGAPELNIQFRHLVKQARKYRPDIKIIDRCNLTVLSEPGQEDLIDFLKENRVDVVASLPCYGKKNVNMQRGKGVFEKSIYALIQLNEAGYGITGSGLELDLVYNPIGPFLPPDQEKLKEQYKIELKKDFGIEFNNLFAITNMPIKRFADFLYRRGELDEYMSLLVNNFNPDTLDAIMCTNYLSVAWDGSIYDCDFNQQLRIGMKQEKVNNIFKIDDLKSLEDVRIATDNHCYGCTAGRGSSCQGSTNEV